MTAWQIPPALLIPVSLTLTLSAYLVGMIFVRRIRHPSANPVLIAIVLVGLALRPLHLSYAEYFAGAQFVHFLLGPATVALAIPLVRSLDVMRRDLVPMIVALVGGSIVGLVSAYGLVRLCGGTQMVAVSMAPKSLTTPIAIGVSQTLGGNPSLTAVLAIVSGVLVAITIDPILDLLRITGPGPKGLAAGTAGSGIGAAQFILRTPLRQPSRELPSD